MLKGNPLTLLQKGHRMHVLQAFFYKWLSEAANLQSDIVSTPLSKLAVAILDNLLEEELYAFLIVSKMSNLSIGTSEYLNETLHTNRSIFNTISKY